MVYEEDLEALKSEVSGLKDSLNGSLQELALRIQQQLQESLQETIQQQFKTLLEVQERSRTVQETRGLAATGNKEKGETAGSANPFEHLNPTSPPESRRTTMGTSSTSHFRFQQGAARGNWENDRNDTRYRHENRLKKLKMPTFDGENPDGWILQAERFFTCHGYEDEEKIEAAFICFSGDALLWYQYESNKRTIHSWEEMKRLLLRHFRDSHEGSLYDQFLTIRQEGTVSEYKKQFIKLLAPLRAVDPEVQLSTFMKGLLPSLKAELRIHRPRNVDEAMEIVQDIEEKNKAARQRYSSSSRPYIPDNSARAERPLSRTLIANSTIEIRKLTDSEIQVKRQKGLCFRCDDKWLSRHRCKRKELQVIMIPEDIEDEGSTPDSKTEEEGTVGLESTEVQKKIEVSFQSVAGLSTNSTMKLKGHLGAQEVVILIDS